MSTQPLPLEPVKVGPFYSAFAHMAQRLSDAGADGLVLFNRFLQPDIDLDTLEVAPWLPLSSPVELRLPLRWIAILRGRVDVDGETARTLVTVVVDPGAVDDVLPGQRRCAGRVDHDQPGALDVLDRLELGLGERDRVGRGQLRGDRELSDRPLLRDRRELGLTGAVGDDDEVATDDRQALVGALVGDVLKLVGGDHLALHERLVGDLDAVHG